MIYCDPYCVADVSSRDRIPRERVGVAECTPLGLRLICDWFSRRSSARQRRAHI